MVLVLSTIGFICCIAGVVGIWMFHQTAYAKVANVTDRLDSGLERAAVAHQKVQRALEQARVSVDEVSKESASVSGRDEKRRRATSALRKLVRQRVGPNINELGVRLDTLSDAATVFSSLLQSFQDFAPRHSVRIQPEKLEGWTDQMAQLSTTLRRLEAVVGDNDKESNGREIAAASGAVDLALRRCQAKFEGWQSGLGAAREGVRSVKSETLGWLTLSGIVGTLLCLWVAVAQISLFAHALSWCRGS
jgi:hypothetical protein